MIIASLPRNAHRGGVNMASNQRRSAKYGAAATSKSIIGIMAASGIKTRINNHE